MPQCVALNNIRIVDFGWLAAGPYATFLPALMGAQVIKIETKTVETHRRWTPRGSRDKEDGRTQADRGLYWHRRTGFNLPHETDANKLSIALNLKRPSARQVLKRLVGVSDALIENFGPGVMHRLGVDYDEMREVNPQIVWVSMSSSGQRGPESMGLGVASVFCALGGSGFVTGYKDGPPVEVRLASDFACGTMAAFALLWGLYQARATGKGTFIDLSNREVHSSFIGEFILSAELNKRNPERGFSGGEVAEPHNIYRCKGDDAWVSITVGDNREWRALWDVLGSAPSVGLSVFGDDSLLQMAQQEMDLVVSQWAQQRSPADAMKVLQMAGVPAVAVFGPELLIENEHLQERGVWVSTQDADGEPWQMMGPPWKFSRTPGRVEQKPPKVGEDTERVLGDLLGLSMGELAALREDGALD